MYVWYGFSLQEIPTHTHTHTYEEEQGVRAGEEVYGVGYIYMMKGFVHPKEDSSLFASKFTLLSQ